MTTTDTNAAAKPSLPESQWEWWAGSNDEWFSVGGEPSREAVIAAARQECMGEVKIGEDWKLQFHIVEARQDPVALGEYINFDTMLEQAEESAQDNRAGGDDAEIFIMKPEQQDDLQARIKATVIEWQLAHGLMFPVNTFSHMRNREFVTIDHPHPDQAEPAPDLP